MLFIPYSRRVTIVPQKRLFLFRHETKFRKVLRNFAEISFCQGHVSFRFISKFWSKKSAKRNKIITTDRYIYIYAYMSLYVWFLFLRNPFMRFKPCFVSFHPAILAKFRRNTYFVLSFWQKFGEICKSLFRHFVSPFCFGEILFRRNFSFRRNISFQGEPY